MIRIAIGQGEALVGPLDDSLAAIDGLGRGRPLPLVSDERVWSLYGARLRDRIEIVPLLVPEGEQAKHWPVLHHLLDRLAEIDPDRTTPLLALGGGSIGDVAGLAASLFKRGLPLVQVPTTLLAQADSAVGGKTGIDFAGQKNLIGSFHAPALVLADPSLLASLAPRQFRSGLAEVIKYGAIGDIDLLGWIESELGALLSGRTAAIETAVAASIRAKATNVLGDERDLDGRRALLNFGHSFGHAIESVAGLGRLLHGEAVAVGMVLAMRLSAKLGLAPAEDGARLARLLARAGLPVSLDDLGMAGAGPALADPIARDKKRSGDGVTLILSTGLGRAQVETVPPALVAAFLAPP